MEHELKLQPRYYEYILGGTKDIEIRLYDEKRQKINIGDIIIFKKEPELNESFKVKVVRVKEKASFLRLLFLIVGEPEGIRTPDPRLRRPVLYPAELLTRQSIIKL